MILPQRTPISQIYRLMEMQQPNYPGCSWAANGSVTWRSLSFFSLPFGLFWPMVSSFGLNTWVISWIRNFISCLASVLSSTLWSLYLVSKNRECLYDKVARLTTPNMWSADFISLHTALLALWHCRILNLLPKPYVIHEIHMLSNYFKKQYIKTCYNEIECQGKW